MYSVVTTQRQKQIVQGTHKNGVLGTYFLKFEFFDLRKKGNLDFTNCIDLSWSFPGTIKDNGDIVVF